LSLTSIERGCVHADRKSESFHCCLRKNGIGDFKRKGIN
jgi:hypothetical protein